MDDDDFDDDLDDDEDGPDADPMDYIQLLHDLACQGGADCDPDNVP